MRTSILLSKKKIELFLITTNLQFQHHIILLLFLHCRFFVNLCSYRYLLLAVDVGVTNIAVDFRLFSSFVAPGACPGIRKRGGPKSENLFFFFFNFSGGAQLRK